MGFEVYMELLIVDMQSLRMHTLDILLLDAEKYSIR